jgi:BolA protein
LNTQQRLDEIEKRLQEAMQPTRLEVIDEGHKHVGHAGAKDGRGHFRVLIRSAKFAGLSMVQQHRLVYQAMGELMQSDIHALAIEAGTPEE